MNSQVKRTTVDIDTRRAIVVIARGRKAKDVAEMNHETFIRNALKDRMGWSRKEAAPDSIKAAAKEMASHLVQRDKEIAATKAKAEAEAKAKREKIEAEIAEAKKYWDEADAAECAKLRGMIDEDMAVAA